MSFKSFDRFFVFVLALSTALYFFGAKSYPEEVINKAGVSVSTDIIHFGHIDLGSLVPPVGTEPKEEQTTEDDEPTDEDESNGQNESTETVEDSRTSSVHHNDVINNSERTFHCPLHIRLRSILI